MKRRVGKHFAMLGIVAFPLMALPQSAGINSSTFSTGFGLSSGSNTTVVTAVGELFVGVATNEHTQLETGFLVVLQQQNNLLALENIVALPRDFALHQNYPNPFNPTTTIQFDLPKMVRIKIIVYDLQGREVVRLLNQHLEPGYHEMVWNGRDRAGRDLPSGMYIVLMSTPKFRTSIKMVLLK